MVKVAWKHSKIHYADGGRCLCGANVPAGARPSRKKTTCVKCGQVAALRHEEETGKKLCSECGLIKPISEFYGRRIRTMGPHKGRSYRPKRCACCERAAQRQRYYTTRARTTQQGGARPESAYSKRKRRAFYERYGRVAEIAGK